MKHDETWDRPCERIANVCIRKLDKAKFEIELRNSDGGITDQTATLMALGSQGSDRGPNRDQESRYKPRYAGGSGRCRNIVTTCSVKLWFNCSRRSRRKLRTTTRDNSSDSSSTGLVLELYCYLSMVLEKMEITTFTKPETVTPVHKACVTVIFRGACH